ncbi:GNAT family N-acetyltransferase [Patulibacter sp.]|uniref:GNAT family N-acetyltransferase n=1 Tax=Patulibacter sp. TaxID=1912859 RepID=UPI00271B2BDF|nr:GNAT family N-acetyltransferase [Patulibacter sp.]MDO9407068.1 GNAT family N-acetyltransferase [Patulibacter sp.]
MSAADVRFAGITALPGVLQLVQDAYRGAPSRTGWTTEADLLDGGRTTPGLVADLMVSVRDAVLVVGEPTRPTACCAVGVSDDGAALGMFAVRPEAQGRGTGAAVLAGAERYVRDRWDASALHLSVIRQRTELIAWYERRGYAPTGRTQPFPYGDERYGRPRRDDLELVVLRRELA